MATDTDARLRDGLLLAGAVAGAIAGVALAVLAPQSVSSWTPEWAGRMWTAGAFGGVGACLLLAGSSVIRLRTGQDSRVALAAILLAWVTLLGLGLGAIHGVVMDLQPAESVGMSLFVALPAAAALMLAWVGKGTARARPRQQPTGP